MSRHIIHKQTVTLHTPEATDSYLYQDKVSHMLKHELNVAMDTIFDRVSGNGTEVIRINKLELNLGNITPADFENEFKARVIEQLENALHRAKREARSGGNTTTLSYTGSLMEALQHFLTRGTLPWFAGDLQMPSWEHEICARFTNTDWISFRRWLHNQYFENEYAIERLILQFSDTFISTLIDRSGGINDVKEDFGLVYQDVFFFIAELNFGGNKLRYTAWLNLLNVVFSGNTLVDVLKAIIEYPAGNRKEIVTKLKNADWLNNLKTATITDAINIICKETIFTHQHSLNIQQQAKIVTPDRPLIKDKKIHFVSVIKNSRTGGVRQAGLASEGGFGNSGAKQNLDRNLKNDTSKKENNNYKKKSTLTGDNFIFVQNCGIILLNPFLSRLFAELDLLNGKEFANHESQKRAVLLLHYLATGNSIAAEFDLALQKVMCNMDIEEPLPNEITLTDKEVEETEQLLRVVTQHWKPLNNTSVHGLQTTFLQREGKMQQTDTGWKLFIESKTVDILIGKLPWGFSTIRLPWMKNLLHVEWY